MYLGCCVLAGWAIEVIDHELEFRRRALSPQETLQILRWGILHE